MKATSATSSLIAAARAHSGVMRAAILLGVLVLVVVLLAQPLIGSRESAAQLAQFATHTRTVRVQVTTPGAVQSGRVTMLCASGERVIAGGYAFDDPGYRADYDAVTLRPTASAPRPILHLFRVLASYPSAANGDPAANGTMDAVAWTIAFAGALWTDRSITVDAYCVNSAFETLIKTQTHVQAAVAAVATCPADRRPVGGGFLSFPSATQDATPIYASSQYAAGSGVVDSWRVSSDPAPPASASNQQFEAFAVCVPTSAFAWHELHESFYFEQPSSRETDCCASTYTQELTETCVPGDLTLPIGFTLQPPDDPLDLRVVASRVIGSARVLRLDVGGAKELDATRSGSPPIVELRSYCLQPLRTVGLGADPALGPQSAPVTLVEYGDFACPTCKAWHQAGVLKQVRAKYGDRLRFVWRDFPIIAPESFKAAEAGQCANDQGKFWPYHDLLFERAPALGVSDLKADARAVGLDGPRFDRCLDTGQETAKVNHNLHDAESHGFRGTPSYLLNGQAIIGAPSLEYLETLIDEALASQ